MQQSSRCSECEKKYAIFDKEPDCENCTFNFQEDAILIGKAYIAFKVWKLVYNQVIMSFDGAVDINVCAVTDILNYFDLPKEIKLEIVSAILDCWRHYNDMARKEKELSKSKIKGK